MPAEPNAIFVAGTDTGVGKTRVGVALLRGLVRDGWRAVGMKPVAAGLVLQDGAWVSDDALALRGAANVGVPPWLDNPVALTEPMAPQLAAARAGRRVLVAELLAAQRTLATHAEVVVVEGAGGWRTPLNPHETLADLAVAIAAPVVLVVGLRLGCLNHALLTAEAIQADGLTLAGWVANCIDPAMRAVDENIALLQARLAAPLLGACPWVDPRRPPQLEVRLPAPWGSA